MASRQKSAEKTFFGTARMPEIAPSIPLFIDSKVPKRGRDKECALHIDTTKSPR